MNSWTRGRSSAEALLDMTSLWGNGKKGWAKKIQRLTSVIRPSGPVPLTFPRGTPFSKAIFLARGLAKNLGLSPPFSGAFISSDPPPDPYFFSSAGVPNAGVCLELSFLVESSFWGEEEDLDSPEEASEEVGWESPVLDDFSAEEDSSEEGLDSEEEEEDSLARASAPAGSSPSSPMMAIVFPTVTPLAPSSTWVLVSFKR
jgi:hypothetical protein